MLLLPDLGVEGWMCYSSCIIHRNSCFYLEILLPWFVCWVCISQVIGCEDQLQNDLDCVGHESDIVLHVW